MNIVYVLRSILALVIIIRLANVLLEKLSHYIQGQTKTIQIVERFSISKNSSLAIVKILNDYYLMNLNEKDSKILKEFTAAEVEEIVKRMQEENKEVSELLPNLDFSKVKSKYADWFGKDEK